MIIKKANLYGQLIEIDNDNFNLLYGNYLFFYYVNVLNLTQFLCLIYTIVLATQNFTCPVKQSPFRET